MSVAAVVALLGLGGCAFVIGRLAEPAMTSCQLPGKFKSRPNVVVTVESRMFPPWKFNCVFSDVGGKVLAKTRAPYP